MTQELPKEMKVVFFHGPKNIQLRSVTIPELKRGEVLVKINCALTCGTDFKAYRQGHPVLFNNECPAPFGHEFAGEVIAAHETVNQFKIGDRVVAGNSAPCLKCALCQKGCYNLCPNKRFLNGAYAQYMVLPENIVKQNTFKIPNGLADEVAAMTEPLSCVVRAYDFFSLKPKDHLAILGAGFMALCFLQLAKKEGIEVTVIGRSHAKLDLAKRLGADHILSVLDEKNAIEKAKENTPEDLGFDGVVEAVGQPETWSQAISLARPGGAICAYGGCKKGTDFALDTYRLHYEELKVFGAFHHTPKHFKKALNLLAEGAIDTKALIAEKGIALENVPEHFAEHVELPFRKTVMQV